MCPNIDQMTSKKKHNRPTAHELQDMYTHDVKCQLMKKSIEYMGLLRLRGTQKQNTEQSFLFDI